MIFTIPVDPMVASQEVVHLHLPIRVIFADLIISERIGRNESRRSRILLLLIIRVIFG